MQQSVAATLQNLTALHSVAEAGAGSAMACHPYQVPPPCYIRHLLMTHSPCACGVSNPEQSGAFALKPLLPLLCSCLLPPSGGPGHELHSLHAERHLV
jgi:hypothetical protein